ncbi:pci domain-containing protein 2 [Plasmopara halstedii]|uniref:Pci domain-containing protein 2 n=1 Tax=Plasmopara halstedii TaxID=4781 RepID=A0A0P1AVU6_PLAHL|nr:pci domain-containing protein 2 [Plasmopara halstedii]CEG45104.1 pci domain-containing protein 2 [Plasmopara halstedii]|eukprot:XP_024581473.1 pci domain-containing protein 2 [Plasmopara halstedii]
MKLAAFVDRVEAAIASQDGKLMAQMLRLTGGCADVELHALTAQQVAQTCQNLLTRFDGYAEVVAGIIEACKHLSLQSYTKAYSAQIGAVIKFMEMFREETNWVMPFLHVLFVDTRLLAARADNEASQTTGDEIHDSLRSAEQHLKKGFAMAANDRAPLEYNKKIGALFIVNQLFKIYFKLNMIHLCRNLIRAVEGPAFPKFELFDMSDKVTYQYYVGRISMFEDQYQKAEKCLDYAWKHCHRSKIRNKRMILQFLVPVKLLLGIMPSPKLLSDFGLEEYSGLTDAIRGGNLHLFTEYLARYQDKFIQQGVYLLIEKLRLLVLRNLFKKVYLIQQNHQLQMQDFQLALKVATGRSMEMDEIECVLTNLIFKGYIKGYMSHMKKILVVSKTQPFPSILDVSK